jgi:hypothetical protein
MLESKNQLYSTYKVREWWKSPTLRLEFVGSTEQLTLMASVLNVLWCNFVVEKKKTVVFLMKLNFSGASLFSE